MEEETAGRGWGMACVSISGGPTWLRCGRVGGLGRVWGGLAAVPVTRCVSFCGYLCGIRVGSVRRVDARSDSFLIGSSRPHCSYNRTLIATIRDYSSRRTRTSRLAFAVRGSASGFNGLRGGAGYRPSHWCRHWTSASARGVGWKYGPRPSLAAIYA